MLFPQFSLSIPCSISHIFLLDIYQIIYLSFTSRPYTYITTITFLVGITIAPMDYGVERPENHAVTGLSFAFILWHITRSIITYLSDLSIRNQSHVTIDE